MQSWHMSGTGGVRDEVEGTANEGRVGESIVFTLDKILFPVCGKESFTCYQLSTN